MPGTYPAHARPALGACVQPRAGKANTCPRRGPHQLPFVLTRSMKKEVGTMVHPTSEKPHLVQATQGLSACQVPWCGRCGSPRCPDPGQHSPPQLILAAPEGWCHFHDSMWTLTLGADTCPQSTFGWLIFLGTDKVRMHIKHPLGLALSWLNLGQGQARGGGPGPLGAPTDLCLCSRALTFRLTEEAIPDAASHWAEGHRTTAH